VKSKRVEGGGMPEGGFAADGFLALDLGDGLHDVAMGCAKEFFGRLPFQPGADGRDEFRRVAK